MGKLKLTALGRSIFGGVGAKPKNNRGVEKGTTRSTSGKMREHKQKRRALQAKARHHNRNQRRGRRR